MTTLQIISLFIMPIGGLLIGLAALFYAKSITRESRHR